VLTVERNRRSVMVVVASATRSPPSLHRRARLLEIYLTPIVSCLRVEYGGRAHIATVTDVSGGRFRADV
jgi:hypothetical protein